MSILPIGTARAPLFFCGFRGSNNAVSHSRPTALLGKGFTAAEFEHKVKLTPYRNIKSISKDGKTIAAVPQ